MGGSIGIALAPEHGNNPEELMKNADLGLYAAKKSGRGGFVFFRPTADHQLELITSGKETR